MVHQGRKLCAIGSALVSYWFQALTNLLRHVYVIARWWIIKPKGIITAVPNEEFRIWRHTFNRIKIYLFIYLNEKEN